MELLKAMECDKSSCHGALHFIHAQSVSARPSSAWHPGSSLSLCSLRLCYCPSCHLSGTSPQRWRQKHIKMHDVRYFSYLGKRKSKIIENCLSNSIYLWCNAALPENMSWSIVLDKIVEFVIIQEGSGHVSTQFHVLKVKVKLKSFLFEWAAGIV